MKEQEEKFNIDLKGRLREYLPVLFEFIDIEDFTTNQWETLNNNFVAKYLERRTLYETAGNYLLIRPNIYDIITAKLKGDKPSVLFLDFIKKALEELSDNLDVAGKKSIIKTLYGLLVSYDHRFLDYLGELLTLNNILKSKKYKLIKVESCIVNEKTGDFLFQRIEDGYHDLVEVRSFHINEANTKLEDLFSKKLKAKIMEKTGGEPNYNKFYLIPIVWASVEDLRRVLTVFNDGATFKIQDVLEPVAYACLTTADGAVVYKFGTLSTLPI